MNSGWIVALIVFLIIFFIFIWLLVWAFREGVEETSKRRGDKGSVDRNCFRPNSQWLGHGIVQNSASLNQPASRILLQVNINRRYESSCGNKMIAIGYQFSRLDERGSVISTETGEAFGPIAKDGSAYLTGIQDAASITLNPLADNKLEFVGNEFVDSAGGPKLSGIAVLHAQLYYK